MSGASAAVRAAVDTAVGWAVEPARLLLRIPRCGLGIAGSAGQGEGQEGVRAVPRRGVWRAVNLVKCGW